MVKCIKCGAQIQDRADFCHNCGHKREKCSCGAFIDYKPNFCAECGKMTHYGLSFYQAKLDERKLKLDKRKQGLENSRLQLEEKKQQLEAEQKQVKKKKADMKKRKLEVEKFAQELGVETGLTSEEFKNNFVDKGDYIELNRPIGSMRIIAKEERGLRAENWKMVYESIKSTRVGDLKNLRMATIDELKVIYKIKDFLRDCCERKKFEPNKRCWSSTIEKRKNSYSDDSYYVQRLDFSSGKVDEFCLDGWHGFHFEDDCAAYFLLVR